MPLRIANINDFDLIKGMIPSLVKDSKYKTMLKDYELTSEVFDQFFKDQTRKIILIVLDESSNPIGFGAFETAPLDVMHTSIARIIAVYIKEEHRGKGYFKELKEAFEFWGKKAGASYYSISVSNGSVVKDYELYETVYMKEVK